MILHAENTFIDGRDASSSGILRSFTPKRRGGGDGKERFLETDMAKLFTLEQYGGLDQTEEAVNRYAEAYLKMGEGEVSKDSWYVLRQAAKESLPHELTEYFVHQIGDRNTRVVVSADKQRAIVKTFEHGRGYRVFMVCVRESV